MGVWRWGRNVGGRKSVRVTMANYAHSLLYMLWLVHVQPSSSVGITHTKDTAIIVKYYVRTFTCSDVFVLVDVAKWNELDRSIALMLVEHPHKLYAHVGGENEAVKETIF